MKNITFSIKCSAIVFFTFIASQTIFSQTCGTTISTFPYSRGFESGVGSWTQDAGDNFDWIRNSGGTPSSGTGPSTGHSSTWYMYIETSSPRNNGDTANFESPCFNLTSASTATFSFYYHIFGTSIGGLYVELSTDNGSTYPNLLWSQTSQVQTSNGQAYNQVNLNLNAYVGQTVKIRFRGVRGTSWSGDIAIDNVAMAVTTGPEINVRGNGTNIVDGDTTPSLTDDTDFGNVDVTVGTNPNTFTIQNLGTSNLNLTGTPRVLIGGANAADFTVTANAATPIVASGNTTFTITFNPSATGLRTANVTIANNDSNENPYNFNIQGNGTTTLQEMNVQGNAVNIVDGDTTPSLTDDTDFGNVDVTSGTNVNTFTIQNLGTVSSLNLTGGSPYIAVSGTHAADFTVTAIPAATIAAGGSTTFNITFNPSGLGLRTATLTIANNDTDENPYNFDIQGTGTDACGGYITTYPYIEDFETGLGQITQDASDNFDWTRDSAGTPSGSTGPSDASSGTFYLYTEADGNTGNTANLFTPCFDLSSTTNPRLTFSHHMYGSNMGTLNIDLSTDSGSTYPVNLWTQTGQIQGANNSSYIPISIDLSAYIGQTIKIRIQGIVGGGTRSDMTIDYFSVTNKAEPTIAPGGITADLALWLKGNDGLSYTDGQSVSLWQDQGRGSDAKPYKSGQEPTYRDNPTRNVNFNPVVELDNTYSSFTIDSDYSHDNLSEEFLTGDFGYYTQEIFIVLIPDDTPITNSFGFMDVICGDSTLGTNSTDTTGIGFGDYTGRVSGEVICYAYDTYTSSESGDGYAVAEIGTGSSYDNAGIINTRNNSANTQQELYYNANDIETTQNDIAEYANANDTRFWLGRSEGWESTTNARIAEVISYSARKVDTDLTQERNRIQSYLALKYGITLGVNGTSQDYVNSDGTVIWDQNTGVPADDVFNYDVAGIGRDDASGLYQKQSRSVNNVLDSGTRGQGVVTMGLANVYNTNNLNPNTINNKEFLVWGNDGVDLDDPAVVVDVDMSTSITPAIPGGTWVQFNGIARTWKVVESGGDIPEVEVQILTSAVRTAAPPNGQYLMFISDSPFFDPTADYRVMTQTTNELGEAVVETNYDFDGTKYITFGWAPERVYTRSIYFDGVSDYVDMEDALDLNPTAFTISSWIMRESGSTDKSILSKRDLSYTEGYDFKIDNSGRFEVSWKNGSTQSITSSVVIPEDEWHHLAVIYTGGSASIYIDGVLDVTASLSAPVANSRSFNLAAAGKGTLGAFFKGNIDEVRVWDTALNVDQLRYVMNQEIENNSSFVNGLVIPQTITKNEVSSIPWTNLAGYYPMTTYTYTNTKDESGNGNTGALRNLRTVDRQTAPLPYLSQADGDWTTDATWLNNTVQTLPNALSIVDGVTPVNWNIVETNHNVTVDTDATLGREREVLGLFVSSNKITVDGINSSGTGNGLTITHYLELNGEIDLDGESQLVQTTGSDLVVGASGKLYRDQQGTADTYTYNYWSSPVGITDQENNEYSYKLPQIIKDGTTSINFITSSYDGTASPIGLADYWIWKFANQLDDDYASWQHVRSTGDVYAGEGFTMKGPGSGTISQDQNYVFSGKPNNANIGLTIGTGNDYLVGNPYPSAIDAYKFIIDNSTSITGTLYFWEHWGGGSHILAEYQGGYHTLNLSGATTAATIGSNDPDVGTGGTPVKTPGNFIPVSQGFFVVADADGGTINFNNSQRIFHKESSGNSVFLGMNDEFDKNKNINPNTGNKEDRVTEDLRLKLRVALYSVNTIRRQLLVTADPNATLGVDFGYDGMHNESQLDDMYWLIEDDKFVIQGIDDITRETILPLGIYTSDDGYNSIILDALDNAPEKLKVYLHDKVLNIYHDLQEGSYDLYLSAGEYHDRFEVTFTNRTPLSIDENEINKLDVHYSNSLKSIVLINPTLQVIKSIEIVNVLGQTINTIYNMSNETYKEIEVKNLSSGTYIIKLNTENGTVTKKVLVE